MSTHEPKADMNRWRSPLFILVLFMIGKDLLYAPIPYGLRSLAQGLCLAIGIFWLPLGVSTAVLARYWPILFYLAVLFIEAPFSSYPIFVFLEVTSLFSMVLFFIAYHETQRKRGLMGQDDFVRYMVIIYSVVIITSLLMARLHPGLVYDSLFAGDSVGYEIRFKGLYGRAGAMGQAAGLLLGFSAITVRKLPIKLGLVAAAAIALFLTESRSYWIGAFVAGTVTLWLYFPNRRKRALVAVLICIVGYSIYYASGHRIDGAWLAQTTRTDSFGTLSGRTYIWTEAMKGIANSPWIGFGFTMGASGMLENNLSDTWTRNLVSDPRQLSRVSMHNGYVQSLMDSGIIGTFFYLSTLVLAVWRAMKLDKERVYPTTMYALLFLCISNFGDSVIYSGTMFPSVCFWACAVFAMSLKEPLPHLAAAANGDTPQISADRRRFANLLD
jgi:O-antigen ligase